MFGRKRIFLLGMVIFLVGSVFCGLYAHSASCRRREARSAADRLLQ